MTKIEGVKIEDEAGNIIEFDAESEEVSFEFLILETLNHIAEKLDSIQQLLTDINNLGEKT